MTGHITERELVRVPSMWLTRAEGVYTELKEAILVGKIRPGTELAQDQLARAMGISRMPVRLALERLAADGLVSLSPYKSAVVTGVGLEEINEIYFLRGLLESVAVEIACPKLRDPDFAVLERTILDMKQAHAEGMENVLIRANREFHYLIYERAESPRLLNIIEGLWNLFPQSTLLVLDGRSAESTAQHLDILEALRSRDGSRAKQLMENHIRSSRNDLIAAWQHILADAGEG